MDLLDMTSINLDYRIQYLKGKLGFSCSAKPEGFTQATAGLVKPVSPKGKTWSRVLLLEALQFSIKFVLIWRKRKPK